MLYVNNINLGLMMWSGKYQIEPDWFLTLKGLKGRSFDPP